MNDTCLKCGSILELCFSSFLCPNLCDKKQDIKISKVEGSESYYYPADSPAIMYSFAWSPAGRVEHTVTGFRATFDKGTISQDCPHVSKLRIAGSFKLEEMSGDMHGITTKLRPQGEIIVEVVY